MIIKKKVIVASTTQVVSLKLIRAEGKGGRVMLLSSLWNFQSLQDCGTSALASHLSSSSEVESRDIAMLARTSESLVSSRNSFEFRLCGAGAHVIGL